MGAHAAGTRADSASLQIQTGVALLLRQKLMPNDPPHPFSISTLPCTAELGHFRWQLAENGRPLQLSPESYPTEPMAAAAGEDAMQERVGLWRDKIT
jgi:hypothetical protein